MPYTLRQEENLCKEPHTVAAPYEAEQPVKDKHMCSKGSMP